MGNVMRFAIAAMLLAAISTPVTAQTVKDGITKWQTGDAAGAVGIWSKLAASGDADAAFNLGQAYRLGKGAPLDLAKAQSYFEQAARKGHLDGQVTLGLLLFQNGNQVSAMRWLKAAAVKGEPRAMLVVGTAMYNGDGLPRDPVTGYAYVSRAAALGLAPAKSTLAELDAVLPLDVRQKGVALALDMASGKPAPAAKVAAPKPNKPPAKSSPGVIKSATVPPPANPGTGGWRVQLGAFGQRGSAEALFGKLSGKLGGARAFYIPVGAVTRLQAGPYASKAAASSVCAKVAPQPCFPVAP
jgi:cell division septation protein DedD